MPTPVTSNTDAAEESYDDEGRLIITRRRIIMLAAVSTFWFFAGHQPFLPLGLVYASWWLGSQADHTFMRGLRRGWRGLAVCAIAAAIGVWVGPSVGIAKGGGFRVGIHFGL